MTELRRMAARALDLMGPTSVAVRLGGARGRAQQTVSQPEVRARGLGRRPLSSPSARGLLLACRPPPLEAPRLAGLGVGALTFDTVVVRRSSSSTRSSRARRSCSCSRTPVVEAALRFGLVGGIVTRSLQLPVLVGFEAWAPTRSSPTQTATTSPSRRPQFLLGPLHRMACRAAARRGRSPSSAPSRPRRCATSSAAAPTSSTRRTAAPARSRRRSSSSRRSRLHPRASWSRPVRTDCDRAHRGRPPAGVRHRRPRRPTPSSRPGRSSRSPVRR